MHIQSRKLIVNDVHQSESISSDFVTGGSPCNTNGYYPSSSGGGSTCSAGRSPSTVMSTTTTTTAAAVVNLTRRSDGSSPNRCDTASPSRSPPATATRTEPTSLVTRPGPTLMDCVHECAAQLLFTCIRWCKSVPAFATLASNDQVSEL